MINEVYCFTLQRHNTSKHDGKFKIILSMRNHKNYILVSAFLAGFFWFFTALAYTEDGDLGPSDVLIPEPNYQIIKNVI